ncbi:MAG: hypothetical protein MSH34_01800 [Oscillospiraceae bacterium]|nr:hypothetical protein [Oscillospiraceae bacterium]MDD7291896.1 hypothetical protein [Clostridiaceae bacterium]MDY5991215.1 hypothetical protein [Oscillospiraceae bacterium]
MKQQLIDFFARVYHGSAGALLCALHHLKNDKKPIRENTVLFVAHPDDEALFFHTVLKKEKPFVALMTTGKSLRRIKEFKKAMKYYGVHYTYFPLTSRDKREDLLLKNVRLVLSRGNFEKAYTHSVSGEYGHEMHKRVNKAVTAVFEGQIYTTVTEQENAALPELSQETVEEKISVFKNIYTSQLFVLDMWQNWVRREKHIKYEVEK